MTPKPKQTTPFWPWNLFHSATPADYVGIAVSVLVATLCLTIAFFQFFETQNGQLFRFEPTTFEYVLAISLAIIAHILPLAAILKATGNPLRK